MSLLGTLTELQPELSSVMLSSPGLGPALEFSLLHTPEKLVRKEVSTGVLRMAISLRKKSKVCTLLRLSSCYMCTHTRALCLHVLYWSVGERLVGFSWLVKARATEGTVTAAVVDGVCKRDSVKGCCAPLCTRGLSTKGLSVGVESTS